MISAHLGSVHKGGKSRQREPNRLRKNDTTRPALNNNVERVASILCLDTMPRRSTTSAAGPSTQIKKERVIVKTEKVKHEKVKDKRRSPTPEVELESSEQEEEHQPKEEEDGSQQNDAEDYNEREDESPRGNKRRRVNGRGQSVVDGEGGSQPGPPLLQVKTLPRGEDG